MEKKNKINLNTWPILGATILISDGWNNGGEGGWYCCSFDAIDNYLSTECCGNAECDVVCERWYQAGS